MSRSFIALAAISLALAAYLPADEGLPQDTGWSIKADYTDTCSCDATCPCFFGSSPTHAHCEGVTLVEIESGHYEGVSLGGVNVLAVYRGGAWMKFYINNEASKAQTEAAVNLLPTSKTSLSATTYWRLATSP